MNYVILAGLVLAFLVIAHDTLATHYRTGCNECDAVQRRKAEDQKELRHDYEHKAWGRCEDKNCKR
jgi:hypothetical protein